MEEDVCRFLKDLSTFFLSVKEKRERNLDIFREKGIEEKQSIFHCGYPIFYNQGGQKRNERNVPDDFTETFFSVAWLLSVT